MMADEDSIAHSRGRRSKKEKKFDDASPPSRSDLNTNADRSQAPNSGTKRKQKVGSNYEGPTVRSKAKTEVESSKKSINDEPNVDSHTNGSTDTISSFIQKLANKTEPYNGTSMEGKTTNLKITTWNINGLRAWLTKQDNLKFIRRDNADILCFQETKCGNSKIPAEITNQPGYRCYYNGSDDGRSGVLCLTKKAPLKVTYGIGIEIYDVEARTITMEYDKYYIVNVYVPNSGQGLKRLDFRLKWDADFVAYLKDLDKKKPVIVCGDLNVSHHEIDLANPKTNLKTAGFTIGERDNFSKLLDETQLVDIFRMLNPGKPACYTFWTYVKNAREKNIGWRLDYFLLSRRLIEKTCDVIIQSDVQGSDHCPVSIYMSV